MSCVIFSDVEGLQNPECIDECKDSCELHSYSADLSYAGMSTLSIGSVVTGISFFLSQLAVILAIWVCIDICIYS